MNRLTHKISYSLDKSSQPANKLGQREFIEVFYNRQRAHQTLNYKTPAQVEGEYNSVA